MPQNIPTKPTTSKALTASYLSQWIASVAIVWPAVVEIFAVGGTRQGSRLIQPPTAWLPQWEGRHPRGMTGRVRYRLTGLLPGAKFQYQGRT